jgi:superfamily I DNA/RNA helicase
MSGQLTNLNIKALAGTRRKGMHRLRVGDYRVIFLRAAGEIVVLELDRKDDSTYSHLDRLVFTRQGEGLQVTEIPEQPPARREFKPPTRSAVEPERQNPLTVFNTPHLQAIGLTQEQIRAIRKLGEGIEISEALAQLEIEPELVELVADMWHAPARYLEIFDRGDTPTPQDAQIDEGELADRLRSPESADAVAELEGGDFELVLRGSIEEWMFYLHPSQARIVRHVANGPSRVRGGPGTGKTVAALHRARHLVREGIAGDVLLTTFVNVLPSVWNSLLTRFAPADAPRIHARTVDSLAYRIVASVDGAPNFLDDDKRRQVREGLCDKLEGLLDAIGGQSELETEFETVIVGRGIATLDDYLSIDRPGRGRRLNAAERTVVWAAWQHYQDTLRRAKSTDWSLLRLRAAELAENGAGPRFDAIIVDEAQDLTATHVRLLMALDRNADHRNLMFVGDGQQAVYPGGFSLRSVGLDVRGRSFLLHTNWRNTQSIAAAAEAVMGDLPTGDLEEATAAPEETLPRRVGELPQLHLVANDAQGDEVMRDLLTQALAECAPPEIAVLGATHKAAQHGVRVLKAMNVESIATSQLHKCEDGAPAAVRIGTFQHSKGLEFKFVVLVGYDRKHWMVNPFWLKEPADVEEFRATEQRKLFVAMTRARDRLALIAAEPLADRLQQARERCDEWDWTA